MASGTAHITSELERPDNSRAVIDVELSGDKPKQLIFWDIDGTLLDLAEIYKPIRQAMWPKAVARDGLEEVSRVHLAGFCLGTMWRELYRMHAIYELNKIEWKDVSLYENEFLSPGKPGEKIDEAGDYYHQLADDMLNQFDEAAVSAIASEYERNPTLFVNVRIKPTWDLLQSYNHKGLLMVGMSANPRRFIQAVCKYCGLADYLIDCASDTDVPGLKEHKMKYLSDKLEVRGLIVPYDNLLIIGDSLNGDIASGPRFTSLIREQKPGARARVRGILIVEDGLAKTQAESALKNMPQLDGLVDILRLDEKSV